MDLKHWPQIDGLCFQDQDLKENYIPFGTLRRGEHITVLIKVTNKEIPGEFLGRLVLGVEDGVVKVFGATIY